MEPVMHGWAGSFFGGALVIGGALLLRRRRIADVAIPSAGESARLPPGELPVLTGRALVERTRTGSLIEALRLKLGVPPELFDRDVWQVIEAYAEFVQLLPASESHHHAEPGGLFTHAMEVAGLALDARRGQILPRGAAPEAIAVQVHRWTYAVFVAALLHDVGKPIADLRILMRRGGGESEPWSPLAGSLIACGAASYRVEFEERGARDYESHGKLPVLLLNRFVPASLLGWLAADAGLMRELLAFLSGEKAAQGGAIHELVAGADAESVRRNLLTGSRVRFASARRVPLIERLMRGLRALLTEGGRLPLNRSGAAGWVYEGDLWFVSKRLADEVRKHLKEIEAGGDGIPADNQRLFDTWQEYGALVPNPQTGGAVWNVTVVGSGYRHTLTVLRFPLSVLYESQAAYPVQMVGSIRVDQRNADVERPTSAVADGSVEQAKAVVDQMNDARTDERTTDQTRLQGTRDNGRPLTNDPAVEPETIEYLEDVEEKQVASPPAPTRSSTGAPAPLVQQAVALSLHASAPHPGTADGAAPEAARRFMGWLQQGLADGSIRINESGALVHFVEDGMLLVSPRVFKEFARQFGEDGKGNGLDANKNDADAGKSIQRQLLRAGWHLQAEKGVNILTYQVTRGGRAVSQLSGVVIRHPERFVNPVPPANPVLVRAAPKNPSG